MNHKIKALYWAYLDWNKAQIHIDYSIIDEILSDSFRGSGLYCDIRGQPGEQKKLLNYIVKVLLK